MRRGLVDFENQNQNRLQTQTQQNNKLNVHNETRSQQRRVFGDVANANRQAIPIQSKNSSTKFEQESTILNQSEPFGSIERETMIVYDPEKYPNTVYENPRVIKEETQKMLQGLHNINQMALDSVFNYPKYHMSSKSTTPSKNLSPFIDDYVLDIYQDDSLNIDDLLDEFRMDSDDDLI